MKSLQLLSFSYEPDWNLTPWIFSNWMWSLKSVNGCLFTATWCTLLKSFFQCCLFSFSHSFKISTSGRIGWCFLNNLTRCYYSVHHPFLLGEEEGGGGEPPTKFSKRGGLTGPQLWEGVAGKKGGHFSHGGCNFYKKK